MNREQLYKRATEAEMKLVKWVDKCNQQQAKIKDLENQVEFLHSVIENSRGAKHVTYNWVNDRRNDFLLNDHKRIIESVRDVVREQGYNV